MKKEQSVSGKPTGRASTSMIPPHTTASLAQRRYADVLQWQHTLFVTQKAVTANPFHAQRSMHAAQLMTEQFEESFCSSPHR